MITNIPIGLGIDPSKFVEVEVPIYTNADVGVRRLVPMSKVRNIYYTGYPDPRHKEWIVQVDGEKYPLQILNIK